MKLLAKVYQTGPLVGPGSISVFQIHALHIVRNINKFMAYFKFRYNIETDVS